MSKNMLLRVRVKVFLLAALLGVIGLSGCAPAPTKPVKPIQQPPRSAVAHTTPRPPVVQRSPTPARVSATLVSYGGWLRKLEQSEAVPGLVTAVVVDNKVAFESEIGFANAATGEKVTPDTVFRLASLSKAFATALTGLLVNDGRLSWDTRIADVLPFFRLSDYAATRQVTVRDLLGQRTGLPSNTFDKLLEKGESYESLIRKLDEIPLACDVGQCYGYQNVAFSLIGDIIDARTHDAFSREVSKRIFAPLGMRTASYGRAALEASRSWARPHRTSEGTWIPFEPKENYYWIVPAAGVNASLHDMEQWLIAQMGGRPDVLSPALLETLHEPGISTSVELSLTPWRRERLNDANYALGWRVYDYGGETLIFHAGAVEGYRAMIGFFPKYHIGMVIMWNSASATPSGLMPMVFDSLLDFSPRIDWAGIGDSTLLPAE